MEPIEGVVIRELKRYEDQRGWLVEMFRDDELPSGFEPTMGYISATKAGVARGPHEHADQTDGFVFLFGEFDLFLWENRPGREKRKEVHRVGGNRPVLVLVPPGVVHAYRNISDGDAYVLNFPDRLYAGWGRSEPVDEIRHEQDPDTEFVL